MIIKSKAKINIGLHVLNKRQDGYHNIKTIFKEINFFDLIEIKESQKFTCAINISEINQKDNFCTKAFELVKQRFPSIPNVSIKIEKRIPVKSGLGGGSSNGTAVLKGLSNIFELPIKNDEMIDLAMKISSDSPFFVEGGIQIGEKRGEVLTKIKNFESEDYILLVFPHQKIQTKKAFNQIKNHLLNENMDINFSKLLSELTNKNFSSKLFKNDFEMYVFKTHPEIGKIKYNLMDLGAIYASLSGTGSTVFGIFSSFEEAQHAQSNIAPYQSTIINP